MAPLRTKPRAAGQVERPLAKSRAPSQAESLEPSRGLRAKPEHER